MPNTQLRTISEIERDAASGLLARDITDRVMGYLVLIGWIPANSTEKIFYRLATEVQGEIDKRRV